MRDKTEKNRQAKGSDNGRAKLNEKEVAEIKRALLSGSVSQAELGRRYGVSR